MSQLIYKEDNIQVYLTESNNKIKIDQYYLCENKSSTIIFVGCMRYEYCEKFLTSNFHINLDEIINLYSSFQD